MRAFLPRSGGKGKKIDDMKRKVNRLTLQGLGGFLYG